MISRAVVLYYYYWNIYWLSRAVTSTSMDAVQYALSSSSFAWPFQFCLFCTVVTYIMSIATSNVSQVDRLWTFLPTIYTAYFALLPLFPNENEPRIPLFPFVPSQIQSESIDWSPRALLLFFLVTAWMCRLTYIAIRRGLFSLSDEDYRWAVLRSKLHPILFQLVNFTFIAVIQNVLLLTLGYPSYLAAVSTERRRDLVHSDVFLGLWALAVLVIEFAADNQQFVYQTYKHAFLAKESTSTAHTHALEMASKVAWPFASPVVITSNTSSHRLPTQVTLTPSNAHRGFITSGLWAYSRHPNFACELSFWWIICFIPFSAHVYSQGPVFPFGTNDSMSFVADLVSKWESILFTAIFSFDSPTSTATALLPLFPAIFLSMLFTSSTIFTESISKSHYPSQSTGYPAYQRLIPVFGLLCIPITIGLLLVGMVLGLGLGLVWIPAFVPLLIFVAVSLGATAGGGGVRSTLEITLGRVLVPVLTVVEFVGGKWWWYLTKDERERKRMMEEVWGEVPRKKLD